MPETLVPIIGADEHGLTASRCSYEHASVAVSVLAVTGLPTAVAVLSGLVLENTR